MILRALIALPLALPLATTPALASPQWTFCVAATLGSKDVWITELFPAATDRERLEGELKDVLERQGHARVVAQCPQPKDDKVSVVNAQTTAEEYNRKLGNILHAMPAREFPPR